MSDLGPRIGEEEVEPAHRGVREKPLHRVACFKSQHLEIRESGFCCTFAGLAHSSQKTLHGEKVAVRKLARHRKGESPVSRAEIDLKGSFSCEQLAGREAAEIILREELSGLRRAWDRLHKGKIRPGSPGPNPESWLPWRLTSPALTPTLHPTHLLTLWTWRKSEKSSSSWKSTDSVCSIWSRKAST